MQPNLDTRRATHRERGSPDVILFPRGRKATFGNARRQIVAMVHVPRLSDRNSFGDRYAHPNVTIGVLDEGNALSSYSGLHVRLRLQASQRELHDAASAPRGFLAIPGASRCYALQVDNASVDSRGDRKGLIRAMELLERANEAIFERDMGSGLLTTKHRHAFSCELLALVIGLQRIGIEVRIWNENLRAKRWNRQPPDAPDLNSESFLETEVALLASGKHPSQTERQPPSEL